MRMIFALKERKKEKQYFFRITWGINNFESYNFIPSYWFLKKGHFRIKHIEEMQK